MESSKNSQALSQISFANGNQPSRNQDSTRSIVSSVSSSDRDTEEGGAVLTSTPAAKATNVKTSVLNPATQAWVPSHAPFVLNALPAVPLLAFQRTANPTLFAQQYPSLTPQLTQAALHLPLQNSNLSSLENNPNGLATVSANNGHTLPTPTPHGGNTNQVAMGYLNGLISANNNGQLATVMQTGFQGNAQLHGIYPDGSSGVQYSPSNGSAGFQIVSPHIQQGLSFAQAGNLNDTGNCTTDTTFARQDTPARSTLTSRGSYISGHHTGPAATSPSSNGNPIQTPSGGGYNFMTAAKTAPRSFAPVTAGLPAQMPPPPKFSLSLVPYVEAHTDSAASAVHDPFGPTAGPLMNTRQVVGHADPVPDHIKAQRSSMLNKLTSAYNNLPTLEIAMSPTYFPFVEGAKQAVPVNFGVVRLKNIPFSTKRAEIVAFLGRNSKILNDNEEPVHIIMERVTSKTNDAYVEFKTMEDAIKAVGKHNDNVAKGRLSRLGDRPVEVELSSQASLMQDLFPVARGIFWDGSRPVVQQPAPNEPWSEFRGFISEEEMTMLVKHVEVPHRSPFSKECPQRPYECLISTVKKFPWYMTDCITIKQRAAIHKAACELLRLLSFALRDRKDEVNLNPRLMRRLVTAIMTCPGFTTAQKDDIAFIVDMDELEQRGFNQPRFSSSWTHLYSIVAKPGIPLDVIEWYISIIREETYRSVMQLPLQHRSQILHAAQDTDLYWGLLFLELDIPRGPEFDSRTLAECAAREFNAIERILVRALGGYPVAAITH